jgi:hypothetical protein
MNILHLEKKEPIMNILEHFYIYEYNLSKDKLQISDTHTGTHSPIFNLITDHYTKRINSEKTNPQTISLNRTSPHHPFPTSTPNYI